MSLIRPGIITRFSGFVHQAVSAAAVAS